MTRIVVAAAASVLALAGCGGHPTQLVVVVDSDYEPRRELRFLRIVVRGPSVSEEQAERLEYEVVASDPELNQLTLPFSFGVRPRGGDAGRTARIEVTAFDDAAALMDDEPFARRTVRTGFVPGRVLGLDIFLARACADVSCGRGQTCDRGRCVPVEVPAEELDAVDPGRELETL